MDSSDSETEQQKKILNQQNEADITDDESEPGLDFEQKGNVKEVLENSPQDSEEESEEDSEKVDDVEDDEPVDDKKEDGDGDNDDDDDDDDDDDNDDEKEDGELSDNDEKEDGELSDDDDDDDDDDDEKEDGELSDEDDDDDDNNDGDEKEDGEDEQKESKMELPQESDTSDSYDESENEDEYFKLEQELEKSDLIDMHPEIKQPSYEEMMALCKIVRNDRGLIVDDLHKTLPFVTKYEYTKVIGLRAKQLNNGADPFIDIEPEIIDGYTIALKEFEQKKIPFIISRPMPNGSKEYWKLADLEIIHF